MMAREGRNAMTFRCAVSADLFARAWNAVSTEATRYYLGGVHVEADPAGGAILVATDGHVLLAFRDPDGYVPGNAGIVKLDPAMLKACKPSKHGPAVVVVAERGTTWQAGVIRRAKGAEITPGFRREALAMLVEGDYPPPERGTFQLSGALIDGSFPDWKRVVPRLAADAAPPAASFNPEYLAKLGRALGPERGPTLVRLFANPGNYEPAMVRGTANLDGFGVIMPARDANPSPVLPSWADRLAVVEAAPLAA